MRLLWLLPILLLPQVSLSQAGAISGRVEDAKTGLSLPGANVLLVETLKGTATEPDGRYIIPAIPVGIYTLRVSFVGYKTHKERVVVGRDTLQINVSLEPDFARYDEVVVTGMATERSKATADVAVSRIDSRKFMENNEYGSFDQLAMGKVSGLVIQPSTGNVAGGARLILRALTGLNGPRQPTVYVDGVRVDAFVLPHYSVGGQAVSALSQLNPNDIESVEVLKGPAGAALYGTSGSNGVILIKTSKGSFRSPVTVGYRVVLGANTQAKEYDAFTASTPDAANAIFRTGAIGEHAVEVRGGSETVRFLTSYDNRSEDGQIHNDSQDRETFRANLETVPSDRFRLNANAFYLRNDVFRPTNDNTTDGYLANVSVLPKPYLYADSAAIENLVDLSKISRFIGGVDITFSPLRRATLHAGVGYDGMDVREDRSALLGYRLSTSSSGLRAAFLTTTEQTTYQVDGRISYALSRNLEGSTTAGFQAFNRDQNIYRVAKRDFSTSLISTLQAADTYLEALNIDSHERELGIFATQEVVFRDQVFVMLGLRRDYASAIGITAPSIFYPRASFALRIDRLLTLRHLNSLKVRVAYGEAGQLPDPLAGVPLVWGAKQSPVGPGAVVTGIGNANIEPERIGEFEIGIETALFDERLTFEGTYYRQHATNSIVRFQYPLSSGLTAGSVPANLGSAKGWGGETSLSGTPIYSRNYSLDMTLMWQWQDNKVTSLGGAPRIGGANAITEGLPNGAYQGWRSRATFDEEGRYTGPEVTSTDEDGDGQPDLVFFGVPYPKQNGSLLLSFRFLRDFRFSALADWQLGGKINLVDDAIRAGVSTNASRNIALVQIGAVTDPCKVNLCDDQGNVRADFKGYDLTAQEVGSDAYRSAAETVARTESVVKGVLVWGNFLQDTDFFKLREVSIGYDFTDLIRRSRFGQFVRSARFVLAGRNLFTSTTFEGMDPEASSGGAFSFVRGSLLTLPQPRTLYAMFSIGF